MKVPETQDEFVSLRDRLENTINEIERLEEERGRATEALRKQIERILVPYRNQIRTLEAEEYQCRQALLDAYENQSMLADAAMELGEPLPPQFEAKGVSFKKRRNLEIEISSLPPDFIHKEPDTTAINDTLDNGLDIPGVSVTYSHELTFRRSKSGKVGE